jgi:hypothetical protein
MSDVLLAPERCEEVSKVDVVIVTYAPDIHVLRHCLESYELYYANKDRLFIFAGHAEKYLFDQIKLPRNVEIVFREEFPELVWATPYSHQTYFKLWCHNLVQTSQYLVIDSDFLFIKPTSDRDYYSSDGRPLWFYRPWIEGEPPLKWKSGSEAFIGQTIDFNYAATAQWIWDRQILQEFGRQFDIKRVINDHSVLEMLIYGWFAHGNYSDAYVFTVEGSGPRPIVCTVNQVPPTYLDLNPALRYADFADAHCVAFWSHWDLAELKMREFFEDSQLANFGEIRQRLDLHPLEVRATAEAIARGDYTGISGIYSDGWVQELMTLVISTPASTETIRLLLMVPANPGDPDWKLTARSQAAGALGVEHVLHPGTNQLVIAAPRATQPNARTVQIHFGKGFRVQNSADEREFRAQLTQIEPFA